MKYYKAISKDKIMQFAVTLLELERVILNEMSQDDKDKYHVISFIFGI